LQVTADAVGGTINFIPNTDTPAQAITFWTDGWQVEEGGLTDWRPGGTGQGLFIEEGTTTLVTNGSFENGLTGWTQGNFYGALVWAAGSGGYMSTNAAKATNSSGATTYSQTLKQAVAVTNSATYTVTVAYQNTTASGGALILALESASGDNLAVQHSYGQANGYTRVSFSVIATETGTWYFKALLYLANGIMGYVDLVQVEPKTYATSWTDTTRANETATIPTTGLSPTQGTVEMWAYVNAMARRTTNYSELWCVRGQASGSYFSLLHATSANWELMTYDGTTAAASYTPDSVTPDGWHHFAVSWNGSTVKAYIDGALKITQNTPHMPAAFATSLYVGGGAVNGYLNTTFDELHISNIARSDAEIAAHATATSPLTADASTLALCPFDGNLVSDYPSQATITTRALDLAGPRRPTISAAITTTAPAGTAVTISRWRDSANGGAWNAWSAFTGGQISGCVLRYIQFEIILSTTAATATPTLSGLTVTINSFVLMIGGVDRTNLLRERTLRVDDRLNERSTAAMMLSVTSGLYIPGSLDAVVVYLANVVAFAGFAWDPTAKLMVEDGDRTEHWVNLNCVDNHLLADRRMYPETHDGLTCGQIVQYAITNYLAADGVTAGVIQDGPVVTRYVGDYNVSISKVLDDLAQQAGYYWRINPDKTLDFADRSTSLAPWNVTTSSRIRSIEVRKHPENYRNVQYGRPVQDVTSVRTDSRPGDGKTRAFTMNYPLATVPTVKVNGVTKAVGILGLDTGKDWYWQKGSQVIVQDDAGTILISTDTLAVTYQGLFPTRVRVENPAEIATRAAAEGTSGIYEASTDYDGLDSATAALEATTAELTRYARLNADVSYETEVVGLKAGQLQTITVPAVGASGQFLIQEVELQDFGGSVANQYRYTIKALDGSAVGSWIQFYKRLVANGQAFSIRDNEVLLKAKSLKDGVIVGDTLTYSKAGPESRTETMQTGFGEVAS
jgi:hypothetical protein